MTLWNTKELSAELKNGSLPEREKAKYLIFGAVLTVLVMSRIISKDEVYLPAHYSALAVNVFLTIFGTWWLFQRNASGDNKNFVERYICLMVPISVRIIAASILVGIILGIVIDRSEVMASSIVFATFEVLVNIVVFWRLGVWIKRTAT